LIVYNSIQRKFKPGDEAPLGWQGRQEFPEWYKPYLSNYNGHGYLIAGFIFFSLCKMF
jgi:hypothetical protein